MYAGAGTFVRASVLVCSVWTAGAPSHARVCMAVVVVIVMLAVAVGVRVYVSM